MTPEELDAIEADYLADPLVPVDVDSLIAALREAWAEVDRLTRERDAYRKAKAENDERFMLERDEARAEADHWKRMAERREEALDALGAERNTWARQMADLHDERDDAARGKADAEARIREALDERDDARAEIERLRAEGSQRGWLCRPCRLWSEPYVPPADHAVIISKPCPSCGRAMFPETHADFRRVEAEAEAERLRTERDNERDAREAWKVEALAHSSEVERLRRGEVDGIFTSVVHECCERVQTAEAAIARVRALCDDFESNVEPYEQGTYYVAESRILAAIDGASRA